MSNVNSNPGCAARNSGKRGKNQCVAKRAPKDSRNCVVRPRLKRRALAAARCRVSNASIAASNSTLPAGVSWMLRLVRVNSTTSNCSSISLI
ncbi:hypothetical protein D3C85_1365220 [compost metagenome]